MIYDVMGKMFGNEKGLIIRFGSNYKILYKINDEILIYNWIYYDNFILF